MADYLAFNSTSHPIIRCEDDWNELLDHGLLKAYDYIVRVNGSYYEAIKGASSVLGNIAYGGEDNAGSKSGTDADAVIQACIDALTSGGTIRLMAGTFSIDASLQLDNSVVIEGSGMGVTTIQWAGAGADNMIENTSTLQYWAIKNLTLDAADIASCTPVVLDDAIRGVMSNVEIKNTDMTALTLTATTQNSYGNQFSHIIIDDADEGILLEGNSASEVVTQNLFSNITMLDVDEKGIRFNDWVDNNYLQNVLIDLDEAGATGVIWNDGSTPAADVGVYANNFDKLSVDAFGVANDATTILLDLNYCKQVVVKHFYHSPPSDGTFSGTEVSASANAASYWIEDCEGGAGLAAAHQDLYVKTVTKAYLHDPLIAKDIATYAEDSTSYVSINDLQATYNAELYLKTNDGSARTATLSLATADGILRMQAPASKDFYLILGDAAGSNKLSILDSGSVSMLDINSDGQLELNPTAIASNGQITFNTNDGSAREAVINLATADGHWRFNAPLTKNILIKMGDAGATNTVSFRDSADAEVAKVDSDGKFDGTAYHVSGTQVVTSQQAAIANVGAGGADSDGTCRTKVDAILAMLRTHGLIAT